MHTKMEAKHIWFNKTCIFKEQLDAGLQLHYLRQLITCRFSGSIQK